MKAGHVTCRHCCQRPARRPRGLCHTCYSQDSIRRSYPPLAKPSTGYDNCAGTPPQEPTTCMPGTEGKIEVLAGRVLRHEGLWHPADAPNDEDFPHAPQQALAS